MNCAPGPEKQRELLNDILAFTHQASGLKSAPVGGEGVRVTQTIDGKGIQISVADLENVISRSDTEGKEFIQVNFCSGKKILLTSAFIGFKPAISSGLDASKLPKVVTTPDILSVFEAIQDTLHSLDADPYELTVLKRVYEAVLNGGEAIGFDLSTERSWLARIPSTFTNTAA